LFCFHPHFSLRGTREKALLIVNKNYSCVKHTSAEWIVGVVMCYFVTKFVVWKQTRVSDQRVCLGGHIKVWNVQTSWVWNTCVWRYENWSCNWIRFRQNGAFFFGYNDFSKSFKFLAPWNYLFFLLCERKISQIRVINDTVCVPLLNLKTLPFGGEGERTLFGFQTCVCVVHKAPLAGFGVTRSNGNTFTFGKTIFLGFSDTPCVCVVSVLWVCFSVRLCIWSSSRLSGNTFPTFGKSIFLGFSDTPCVCVFECFGTFVRECFRDGVWSPIPTKLFVFRPIGVQTFESPGSPNEDSFFQFLGSHGLAKEKLFSLGNTELIDKMNVLWVVFEKGGSSVIHCCWCRSPQLWVCWWETQDTRRTNSDVKRRLKAAFVVYSYGLLGEMGSFWKSHFWKILCVGRTVVLQDVLRFFFSVFCFGFKNVPNFLNFWGTPGRTNPQQDGFFDCGGGFMWICWFRIQYGFDSKAKFVVSVFHGLAKEKLFVWENRIIW